MTFTAILPATKNFTPSDLIHNYARSTRGATIARDQYFNKYLSIRGKLYSYDHLQIDNIDPNTIAVTVYLKEKAK